jgi:hypothetical protein
MKSILNSIKPKTPLFGFKVDPNSTHREFLEASIVHLLNTTPSNSKIVLYEIGTGGESSRIMYKYMSEYENVYLVSFENNSKWLDIYRNMYLEHNRHKITRVEQDSEWPQTIENELKLLSEKTVLLSFIDSAPWESRTSALRILSGRSTLTLIHDVDYFPHNNVFGTEESEICKKPFAILRYGNLNSKHLGKRSYDDVFSSWVETFPIIPGYFSGPPTLIGSNSMSVHQIRLPEASIQQGKSVY